MQRPRTDPERARPARRRRRPTALLGVIVLLLGSQLQVARGFARAANSSCEGGHRAAPAADAPTPVAGCCCRGGTDEVPVTCRMRARPDAPARTAPSAMRAPGCGCEWTPEEPARAPVDLLSPDSDSRLRLSERLSAALASAARTPALDSSPRWALDAPRPGSWRPPPPGREGPTPPGSVRAARELQGGTRRLLAELSSLRT